MENVIHIEMGDPIIAYQKGDTVPAHLVIAQPTEQETKLQTYESAKRLLDADDPSDKRFKALLLVTLDEINLIRSKLAPALQPRTVGQLKTAIRNKIDAGQADG